MVVKSFVMYGENISNGFKLPGGHDFMNKITIYNV